MDGESIQTNWHYVHGGFGRSGELTLQYENDLPKMMLSSIWRARPGRGPVEHRIEFQNLTDKPVAVSEQDSLAIDGLDAGEKPMFGG